MSHRPTHSTARAQPRSQSSVLVSEEPTTIPQLQPADGFLPAWQAMDEILTGELFLAPAARQARNDPIHDGLGAWARVGFPLWLPGRNQLSSAAAVMGQLEILSKKYIKTYCLASLRETEWVGTEKAPRSRAQMISSVRWWDCPQKCIYFYTFCSPAFSGFLCLSMHC